MTDKKMTKAEERRQDKARHDDMRYIKGLYPARKIPRGRILAHNRVMHTVDMPNGLNGFRCWTWREGLQPEHFVPCTCGWAGLPHYASNEEPMKCVTKKQFKEHMRMMDKKIAEEAVKAAKAKKQRAAKLLGKGATS
jgi:hypothetical protein